MKYHFIVLLLAWHFASKAQQPFIKKLNGANYGYTLRILPTNDLGWVTFSLDALKLTKFNSCGTIEWSKSYVIPNTSSQVDFKVTPAGGFVLLSTIPNGTAITSLDAAGNIVWSKAFQIPNMSQYAYSINVDAAGNLFYDSNISDNASIINNMICKLDANGNIIWSKTYNHGGIWGGSLLTSDNGFLIRTGDLFIKTDANNGNVLWTSACSTALYSYFAPIEVSDGYIFTKCNSSATIKNICFYKLDLQGNLMWGSGKLSNYTGVPPILKRKQNGNIAAVFNENNDPTIIEFDKDLNVVAQNAFTSNISGMSMAAKDACFTNDQFPVIAGTTSDGSSAPFVIKTTKNYAIECSLAPLPMTFTPQTITQSFGSTSVNTILINTTTNNASSTAIAITALDICTTSNPLQLRNDTTVCEGERLLLKNNSSAEFEHYIWSTGATTPEITVHTSGTYWLKASDHCNSNWHTDTFKLMVKPAIVADLGNNTITKCEDASVTLSVPLATTCHYLWSNGSNSHTIDVTEQGIYWLKIENDNGCSSTDTIHINTIKCECSIFVPNSFTPNNDGLNDVFKAVSYCDFKEYNLKIFNRWGQLLFETNDPDASWNGFSKGALVKDDVYTYVINYTSVIKNSSGVKTGMVMLIR